jgi:hypothetical protein
MERDQMVRVASDIAVGLFAAWLLRQLGVKQGSAVAVIGAALVHEAFDAPVASRIQEAL